MASERDRIIDVLIGEAADQGAEGMAAVAHVIANRAREAGKSLYDIISAPKQFTAFSNPGPGAAKSMQDPSVRQTAEQVLEAVMGGQLPDPTGGATHYWAPRGMPGGKDPYWASALDDNGRVKIGDHVFLPGGASKPAAPPMPPHPFPRADMVTARREGIPRPRPAGDAQIARTFASLPSPPPMPVTLPNMAPPPSFGKVSFGAGSTTLEPQTLQPLPPEGVVQGRDVTPPETVGRAGIESPFTRGSVASFPPSSTAFSPYPGMAAPPGVMRTNNGIAGTVQMPPGARPAGVDALLAQATAAQQPAMMSFSPQPRPPLPTQAQMQAIRAVPPQLLRQLTQQAPPLPRQRPRTALPVTRAPTPMPRLNRPPEAMQQPSPTPSPSRPRVSESAWDWIMNGA
jgi:hypothetical protein